MVLNVATFVEDETIKQELIRFSDLRDLALRLCYSIPDYKNADLETKNFVYDNIMKKIQKIGA